MSAMKDFFGYPTLVSMTDDWKSLTQEDREEFRQGLKALGYNIAHSSAAPTTSAGALSHVPLPVVLSTKQEKDGPNYQSDEEPELLVITTPVSIVNEHPAAKAA
jgi:hypothetical protein